MARKSTNKKKHGLGWALVLLAFIVGAIIIAVKWPEIKSNLNESFGSEKSNKSELSSSENKNKVSLGNEDLANNDTDVIISLKNSEVSNSKDNAEVKTPEEKQSSPKSEEKEVAPQKETVEEKSKSEKTEEKKSSENQSTQKTAESTETKKSPETPKTVKPAENKTELQLCFIYITAEGKIDPRIVKRSVKKSDSPLTDALNLLIQGPDTTLAAEKNLNSYINSSTKLLGAKVKDGVAYLNFNEDFCFSTDGNAGLINQLKQIIYTATTFSTVKSVQFLIEGNVEEYIGDGIWIGSPLTRLSY